MGKRSNTCVERDLLRGGPFIEMPGKKYALYGLRAVLACCSCSFVFRYRYCMNVIVMEKGSVRLAPRIGV